MLKYFTAALAALFFLFPLSAVGESLDLSQLGAIEEAEHWEERAWYQREDGSDWRVAVKDPAAPSKFLGVLTAADTAAFAGGMVLADGLECLPAGLELLSPQEALVTLREGKFHQVKRMLAACGKPVTYLKRLSMGPLRLDEALAPGAFRPLTDREIHTLLDICGLNAST